MKWKNKPTIYDGIRFASIGEKDCYRDLRLIEKARQISNLRLQPRYKLVVNGELICIYVADFEFLEIKTNGIVAIEFKGYETEVYKLKAKLFKVLYPHIDLRIVR